MIGKLYLYTFTSGPWLVLRCLGRSTGVLLGCKGRPLLDVQGSTIMSSLPLGASNVAKGALFHWHDQMCGFTPVRKTKNGPEYLRCLPKMVPKQRMPDDLGGIRSWTLSLFLSLDMSIDYIYLILDQPIAAPHKSDDSLLPPREVLCKTQSERQNQQTPVVVHTKEICVYKQHQTTHVFFGGSESFQGGIFSINIRFFGF